MEIDANKLLENALKDGLRDAVKQRFAQSYNNPLDKLMDAAIAEHTPALRKMLSDAIAGCVGDDAFRRAVADEARAKLAKILLQKFGGELEKQVNALKSDPATRARITLAVEEIVKDRSLATA